MSSREGAHLHMSCKVPSLACTTTPCPIADWPPVTWKGSGAHVPLSVQAAPAPARSYSRLCFRPALKNIEPSK
ncbi:unnamed protein product [Spirodela intermedia]|uniref:Uncharacterized protein n=1 Tax=Spirodela intermedia TaxID=51605 RepID=A0A7I8J6U5_SPIIN|nr:unnamed protein product [Spirodela intermedia]CAA6665123.1 unnamed protein product [Spirodela intermedia]